MANAMLDARQEGDSYRRDGIHLDRATLAGWVKRAAWWLKSLYELQLSRGCS
jgi:transposase